MAVERTLSNPTVEVNNTVIAIKSGSLSVKNGKGNITIRPQSAGGDSIEVVITEDAETKKGMVKFTLLTTKTNVDYKNLWQSEREGVSIRLSEDSFTLSFRNMFIVNDPEVKFGADGEVEFEFEGQPAI